MEFSKKIFISIWILSVVVTLAAFVLMFMTEDLSPLSYLIPAVFAELATGTGFYYNKAKLENKLKIMKSKNMKINKEDLIELIKENM